MDFKTLDDIATWMLTNVRLSRYDQQFVNNISMYSYSHNRITTNQHNLFIRIIEKYNKQFHSKKIDVALIKQLPWHVPVVPSLPEYTNPTVYIEEGTIVIKAPYNKAYLKSLRESDLYKLQWDKENKQHLLPYSISNLKNVLSVTSDHFTLLECSDEIKELLNRLTVYDTAQFWNPTLVYRNDQFIVHAFNQRLNDAICDIQVNDLKSLADLARCGIEMHDSVIDYFSQFHDNEKVKFACANHYETEAIDFPKIIEWLHELECDFIKDPGHGLSQLFRNTNVLQKNRELLTQFGIDSSLQEAKNPVFLYYGSMAIGIGDTRYFKVIKCVNSSPINLNKNETM
jgi:hypothetical protein